MPEDLRTEDPTMTTDTPITEDHHLMPEDRPTANPKTDTTPMAPGGRHHMQEDPPTAALQILGMPAIPETTPYRAWKIGLTDSGKGTTDLAVTSVGTKEVIPTILPKPADLLTPQRLR